MRLAATDPLMRVSGVEETVKPVALYLISMNGSDLQEVQEILVSLPSLLPRRKGRRGKRRSGKEGELPTRQDFLLAVFFMHFIQGISSKCIFQRTNL